MVTTQRLMSRRLQESLIPYVFAPLAAPLHLALSLLVVALPPDYLAISDVGGVLGSQVRKNEMNPFILSGCTVVEGDCSMLVTAVGRHSEWGKIMVELDDERDETPLQVCEMNASSFGSLDVWESFMYTCLYLR